MENETAEAIISKYEESICDFNGNQFAIIRPLNAKLAMEEYASIKLAEKDKVIHVLINDYSRVLEHATLSEVSKVNYDVEKIIKLISEKQKEFYYDIVKSDVLDMIEKGCELSELKDYFESLNK